MTIFLFSAPISCEGEKEEKLLRNKYVVHLTNDAFSEMTEGSGNDKRGTGMTEKGGNDKRGTGMTEKGGNDKRGTGMTKEVRE